MDKKTQKKVLLGVVAAVILGVLFAPCFTETDGVISVFYKDQVNSQITASASNSTAEPIPEKETERENLVSIIGRHLTAEPIVPTEEEKSEEAAEAKRDTDQQKSHDTAYANQFVTKERGSSEEFFQDTENRNVILDFGKGGYDITAAVEKWMYGEPIINLNHVAKIMGLSISLERPDEYVKLPRSEAFWPEDVPDLEERYDIYLVSPDGKSIRYTTGSTIQDDSDRYGYLNLFQVEGNKEDGYTTYVSVSELPYYDGTVMKAGVPASFQYGKEAITITLGKPEESKGYLLTEHEREISAEEYMGRGTEE